MDKKASSFTFVPYQQKDETPRRAAITRVDFSLDGLSDSDIQVLGHLSDAADLLNPIYRDQYEPKTVTIERLLGKLYEVAAAPQKEIILNYLTILNLQNSPFSLLPRKNHLLGLSKDDVNELVKKAGGGSLEADLEIASPFLFNGLALPDKVGLYPEDMTEAEWEALGDEAQIVNMSFERQGGKIVGRLNEEKYRETIRPIIDHLLKARALTQHPDFQLYLDSKIEELRHGTRESRRIADFMWIRHGAPVDIIISSALEVYLDNWKNARGEAAANVMIENREAQTMLQALVDKLPGLEATAPWKHRKMKIDKDKLPHLRFVDVLNWSGDYVNSPMTIVAQSLPNDNWVINNVGSVNMVYRNTGKAIYGVSGELIAKEFLPKDVFEKYGEIMFEATQIHSALHELGHTTGAMAPEFAGKEAREALDAEYSPLEEARAELFGMWAMPQMAREGIFSKEMAEAGHYGMVISMVGGLRFLPEQAHVKARNLMWHYFVQHGGVEEVLEEGKKKFRLRIAKIDELVAELLGKIGDTKATCDRAGAVKLRETYCFADPMREDVEKRMATFPLGRGLIFPRLKRDGERYLAELEYPEHFIDQPRYQARLLD
ncbi:hypothetical protein KKC97_03980 [bacterium]|nr:hypothetical protein [bacterium]